MPWPRQCIEGLAPYLPCGACRLEIDPGLVRPLKDGSVMVCREFHTAGRDGEARLRSFATTAVWLNQLTVRLYEALGFLR